MSVNERWLIFTNVLYTTNCPKCRILEKKLNELGIAYETNTNVDEMQSLGMMEAPGLKVDDHEGILGFSQAIEWLKIQSQEGHA